MFVVCCVLSVVVAVFVCVLLLLFDGCWCVVLFVDYNVLFDVCYSLGRLL